MDKRKVSRREKIISAYFNVLKRTGSKSLPTLTDMKGEGISRGTLREEFGTLTKLQEYIERNHSEKFTKMARGLIREKKDQLAKDYSIHVGINKESPNIQLIPNINDGGHYTYTTIRRHFGSLKDLDTYSRLKYPENFSTTSIKSIVENKKHKRISERLQGKNRIFVSTAVTGCMVDQQCLKAVDTWKKSVKGVDAYFIAEDPASSRTLSGEATIDPVLANRGFVFEDTRLNDNLWLSSIHLGAKQIDATTGLEEISQTEGTFIYASPKQRLRPVPIDDEKYIHLLVTTGAITKANYTSPRVLSDRTARIADNDHKMGGVIIEIQDDQIYFFRHIQFDVDGSFIDLDTKYNPDGSIEKVTALSFWPGDYHNRYTDPLVKQALKDICARVRPDYFMLNDFFDGDSINPHEDHDPFIKAQKAVLGKLSLADELRDLKDELEEISTWDIQKQIVVVESNHDDFLGRYLKSFEPRKDPLNAKIAHLLAYHQHCGRYHLEFAVNKIFRFSRPEFVRWLRIDEPFRLAGINHGIHGHLGANGQRNPSTKSLQKSYKACNAGHSHAPEIYRNCYRAGTSSFLKLGYNKGASSWAHAHILTHHNGSRQLIFTINGRYTLDV